MAIYASQHSKSLELRVDPHRGGNGVVLWLPDGGRLSLTEGSALALLERLEEIVGYPDDEDEVIEDES